MNDYLIACKHWPLLLAQMELSRSISLRWRNAFKVTQTVMTNLHSVFPLSNSLVDDVAKACV